MTDAYPPPEKVNEHLRSVQPGDDLSLECVDRRTRTVTVTDRKTLQNESVVLFADGHGTTYQINTQSPEYDDKVPRIRWTSGNSFIRGIEGLEQEGEIWSDTTAADLGIPQR